MEEEYVNQVHKLYEVARPKALTGDNLQSALSELYDFCKPQMETLIRRPDGSRIYQLIFRRGDSKMRLRFLTDFTPFIYSAITTKYSCHIIKSIIKNGNKTNRTLIFDALVGKFDTLLIHRIAAPLVSMLYENIDKQQKERMFMDFYGPQFKNPKKVLKFSEICAQGNAEKKAAIESLSKNLTHVCDKGNGGLKLTHALINILGDMAPEALEPFLFSLNDLAFDDEGSVAAIRAIINSKPKQVYAALLAIEPKSRTSKIGGIPQPEPEPEPEEDEGEGEEDGEEDVPEVVLNNTARMACDRNGCRVLSCAISYLEDPQVVIDEVLPNLMDYWEQIKVSDYATRVLLRMITAVPSFHHQIQYQKDQINETLKDHVIKALLQRVPDDIVDLCQTGGGVRLVIELMNLCKDDEESFRKLREELFTADNVTDKIMHKTIRSAIQSDRELYGPIALKMIREVGLADVLKTPGAWILVELCKTDKKLLSEVQKAIKKHKILEVEEVNDKVVKRPAIEALLNPDGKPEAGKSKRRRG